MAQEPIRNVGIEPNDGGIAVPTGQLQKQASFVIVRRYRDDLLATMDCLFDFLLPVGNSRSNILMVQPAQDGHG
jgi:hypothetical protein